MVEVSQQEQRRAPRINLDISGAIETSDRYAAFSCVVRDISETGARLAVQSGNHVPDAFRLHLEHEGFSAESIVVWRSETEVGVIFETAPEI